MPNPYSQEVRESDYKLVGTRALQQAQRNPHWVALKMKRRSVGFKYSPIRNPKMLIEAQFENAADTCYRELQRELQPAITQDVQ